MDSHDSTDVEQVAVE
jgi:hypothetical protein